jgi:hypothetical protein
MLLVRKMSMGRRISEIQRIRRALAYHGDWSFQNAACRRARRWWRLIGVDHEEVVGVYGLFVILIIAMIFYMVVLARDVVIILVVRRHQIVFQGRFGGAPIGRARRRHMVEGA